VTPEQITYIANGSLLVAGVALAGVLFSSAMHDLARWIEARSQLISTDKENHDDHEEAGQPRG
jgi:hypothetical protein